MNSSFATRIPFLKNRARAPEIQIQKFKSRVQDLVRDDSRGVTIAICHPFVNSWSQPAEDKFMKRLHITITWCSKVVLEAIEQLQKNLSDFTSKILKSHQFHVNHLSRDAEVDSILQSNSLFQFSSLILFYF